MPIYEYECAQCKKHYEMMQRITEKPLKKCSNCDGDLKKIISNTSFVLKGTGWYATDYASSKAKSETKESATKQKKNPESATEQKKDRKSDEKADTKETVATK
jgi:putative FmdB family regulatory protein